jgi:hypothetical protein
MNRISILTITCILLGSIAYFVIDKDKSLQTTSGITQDRDFALKSMEGITNIVLKHAKLQPMQFQRKGEATWVINNAYAANPEVMRNLTQVLTGMKLNYTPSNNTIATIKEEIKRSGIKVDIYAGKPKPIKSFYIASDTEQQDGTFMMMEGGSKVYVMHLPTLNGGFRSRFEQPLDRMRDIYVYKEVPEQISSIEVRYNDDEAHSFKLTQVNGKFDVQPILKNVKPLQNVNQQVAKNYVYSFASIGAESLINTYEYKNDLLKTTPYCTILVTNSQGYTTKATYYSFEKFTENLNLIRSQDDIQFIKKYFIWVNDRDLYLGQRQLFNKVFGRYKNFFTS